MNIYKNSTIIFAVAPAPFRNYALNCMCEALWCYIRNCKWDGAGIVLKIVCMEINGNVLTTVGVVV